MMRKNGPMIATLALLTLATTQAATAETPTEILSNLETTAKQADRGFRGFSTQRGEQFFKATHGNEWSCASCHGNDATATGKHAKTGKLIQPLAPAANAERFTDPARVEKWFKRNCNNVLGRACTAQEKGSVARATSPTRRSCCRRHPGASSWPD